MECSISFSEINWLSVLVATVVAFAIGGLWYSPLLFSKTWVKELKISEESINNANMPLVFGTAFLLNFISAVVLDLILGTGASFKTGLFTGMIISIVFIASSLGITYLFSRKSLKLFLIDAGYFVIFYSVMGAILGAWN